MSKATRYAAYWAPERDDALWRAGCAWLGRDPERGGDVAAAGADTSAPRRYGFHATLLAPTRLKDGVGGDAFAAALAAITARTRRFAMPPLELTLWRGFVALRPASALDANHPLRQLADACVNELDPLREPASAAESQRRQRSHALDAREAEHLRRWGYPYVFDRWQFHLTLSNTFGDDDRPRCARLLADAKAQFAAALAQPRACTSLSIFVEPAPGEPFVLSRRVALAS